VSAAALSVNGAAQVLRPPEDGLPYLRHDRAEELRLEPGSLHCEEGVIAGFEPAPAAELQIDASGCAVLPGLVDCHTHLPFAGWRAAEYEMKVRGVSYEEIARSGGGIRSSARALAEASDDAVLGQATALAGEMLQHGTTVFECKSGYGLSREGELRALRLAQLLGDRVAQATVSTALLAHAVPDGFTADAWIGEVEAMLPTVVSQTAAQALDIYVESVAFTNDHLARMGRLAAAHQLDLRAHVEQFNANRSVPVALEAGARSVDHLARLAPDDVEPLARAECAAVLLPGAEFLGAEEVAPARALADAGAICALATDANPGTSPVVSLPLVIGLAARRYGWSVREALLAVTLNAAWVVRMSEQRGSIETGKRADLVLLDGPADHVPYRFGHNPVELVVIAGEPAYVRPGSEWRLAG
jgi:imidazolonepropionase